MRVEVLDSVTNCVDVELLEFHHPAMRMKMRYRPYFPDMSVDTPRPVNVLPNVSITFRDTYEIDRLISSLTDFKKALHAAMYHEVVKGDI